VHAHGALKTLAAFADEASPNDVRCAGLASDRRAAWANCGIPENEPGSVVQAGKVNTTHVRST